MLLLLFSAFSMQQLEFFKIYPNFLILLVKVQIDVTFQENIWQYLIKIKIYIPHHLAVLLLGIDPRVMRTYIHQETCAALFTVVLYITSPMWKTIQIPTHSKMINTL